MKKHKFELTNCGSLVLPIAEIDAGTLRGYLPVRFRQLPQANVFLEAVAVWAAQVAHMAEDTPSMTHAEARDHLEAIKCAADKLQVALQPIAENADEFSGFYSDFSYLRERARDTRDISGRPVIPALPSNVPPLPELLARIESDMKTLRTACAHTAGNITPARSVPKDHERMLVRGIAELYQNNFGELPPKRGQFADAFIEHVAQAIGMDIGHRVVGEVVSSMR